MIHGIGTDIVEIVRVKKALEVQSFLKNFSQAEQRLFHKKKPEETAAGHFAAKEAVAKALGTGFSGFGPEHIEILRNAVGKPYAVLHGEAQNIAENLGICKMHVSISHCKDYATAFALAEIS